jgi:hypothetical protein
MSGYLKCFGERSAETLHSVRRWLDRYEKDLLKGASKKQCETRPQTRPPGVMHRSSTYLMQRIMEKTENITRPKGK